MDTFRQSILMQQNELFTFAEEILALIGESPLQVSFLARGATCNVWVVLSASQKSYALRIIEAEERVIDGVLDAFIRNAMLVRGGRVVASLLSSEIIEKDLNGKRWVLDAFVRGTHPERGAFPDAVCRQLGETLAILHQLPVRNFGRLSRDEQGVMVGEKTKPMEGVKQRFENPLPETWDVDFVHPVLSAVSELKDEITARLRTVSEEVEERHAVLCHTDLHEQQLLCNENGLAALIDFGEVSIHDKHWDLGSVYYFHGKDNFAKLYDTYLGFSGAKEKHPELVSSFSIAIAMHHASRSRLPGKHHRFKRAIQHIQQVIMG